MEPMTIRHMGEDLKERLKKHTAEKGVSMAAEARRMLKEGVRPQRVELEPLELVRR